MSASNLEQVAAWQRLEEVVKAYDPADQSHRMKLHQAANAYAATCKSTGKPTPGRVVGTGGRELRGGFVAPFGNDKGVALEEIETSGLEWLANAVESNVRDPERARFKAKNQQLLNAIRKELATR
ncbi:MAG: hypothetical protein Q8L48_16635 [Archangium sp.]|nr:hypothetical protein [Archangium sp.]